MTGTRHEWLDDDTAERLLRGEPVGDPGTFPVDRGGRARTVRDTADAGGGPDRVAGAAPAHATDLPADSVRRLAALLAAASAATPTDSAGEDAAVAAFRAARSGPATAQPDAAFGFAARRPSGPDTVGRQLPAAHDRLWRLRTLPRSAKAMVATAVAATALAGGVAAAAGAGVILSPFIDGGGQHRPVSPSATGTSATHPGQHGVVSGASSSPSDGTSAQSSDGTGPPVTGGLPTISGGAGSPDSLCRSYLTALHGHSGTAQRQALGASLAKYAGGAPSVAVYCEQRLGLPAAAPSPTPTPSPTRTAPAGGAAVGHAPSGSHGPSGGAAVGHAPSTGSSARHAASGAATGRSAPPRRTGGRRSAAGSSAATPCAADSSAEQRGRGCQTAGTVLPKPR